MIFPVPRRPYENLAVRTGPVDGYEVNGHGLGYVAPRTEVSALYQERPSNQPDNAQIHPWRVTASAPDAVDVLGGIVSTQDDFTATAVTEQEGLAVGASGFVILTINRDSDTRALTGTPAISFSSGSLTPSDEGTQIIPLAEVIVEDGNISEVIQMKFENLHIFEDLVVRNGEFQYADLLFASRNPYDLPAP